MNDASQVLTVVDHLYGAILEDAHWPKALSALGRYMGGNGTFYFAVNQSTGVVLENGGVDADPMIHTEYANQYGAIDVQIPPALAVPVGHFMTEYNLLANRFESSEIYGEFYERWNIPYRVAVWVEKSPTMLAAVSIQRSKGRERFLKGDFERYQLVLPHLLRACRTRELLRSLRLSNRLYFDIIDRLPFGVVLLTETGQVIELTQSVHRLLKAGGSIGYKHRHIFALHSADNRTLQAAIGRTLRLTADGLIPGDTIRVRRLDRGRPLNVAVIPIRSQGLFAPLTPRCMLMFFDPDAAPRPALSAIKEILHLTEAEALLASLLLSGITLREAAERLHLSINTCKTQLKSVYAKTGCRNHVDLAKTLLMTGIAHNF